MKKVNRGEKTPATYIDTCWIGGVVAEASGEFGQKEAGADRDQQEQRQAADAVRRSVMRHSGWIANCRFWSGHDGPTISIGIQYGFLESKSDFEVLS